MVIIFEHFRQGYPSVSIRVLPQHQDTGGFFVAMFRKVCQLPWQPKTTPTGDVEESSSAGLELALGKKPIDLLGK